MKNAGLLFIIIAVLTLSCKTSFVRGVEKKMKKIPGKEILISKFEITNQEYNAFLESIKISDRDKYNANLIDTLKWQKINSDTLANIFLKNYHSHPAYNNYPVVNVTYESAKEYCVWLTEQYNKSSRKNDKKVLFRLPTTEEFNVLLDQNRDYITTNYYQDYLKPSDSPDYPYGIKANLKYKNRENDSLAPSIDWSLLTSSGIADVYQQKNGFYSVIGNVSELTIEKVALGGNWDTFPTEVFIEIQYVDPDPRIGFRVVMEVLE